MEISNGHHQGVMAASHPLEEVLVGGNCPNTSQQQEKIRVRPQPEQALRCPRCDSTNTKFCYYNNYSLSQPRYFCKGCRRYWTKGGSLRNVPVGGGCRKNKRSSSSNSSTNSSRKPQDLQAPVNSNPLLPSLPPPPPPPLSYEPSDLTLAFSMLHNHDNFLLGNPNPNPNPVHPNPSHISNGFLDILRNGFVETSNPSGFHNPYYGLGGNGSVEEVEGGNVGGEEVVLPIDRGFCGATFPVTSQGSCKDVDGGENKGLVGHQWQVSGDNNMGVESTKDYWNGAGSYWHGLINSSLM